jgi:zinc protease
LEVLEEIMGGGPTSRLYKSLVVDQKIASGAGLSYRPNTYDDVSLWVYATPLPGVHIGDLEDAVDDALRKLIAEGVTDAELSEAKTRMQDAAIYARDSLAGPAMVIGYSLATGSSLNDVETWPAQIEAVTAADVQEVAELYLNPDAPRDTPPVTGILMPETPKEVPKDAPAQEAAE